MAAVLSGPAAAQVPPPAPQVLGHLPGGAVPVVGEGGWEAWGAQPPEALPAGGLLLRGNTSVVSPPFAVPAGAQSLRLTVASPGLGAMVRVAALPDDGGPEVELGVRVPTARAGTVAVGLSAVAGRTVRVVVDPMPAFGAALRVLRVGPVTAPLPGWTVTAGVADATVQRPRELLVEGEPFAARSGVVRGGAGAAALLVAVRGDGTLRVRAGGRRVSVRAGATWRDVRVPLGRGARLDLAGTPGDGALRLRDVGLVVRRVAVAGVRARQAGGRRVVEASTRPAAPRAAYAVADRRGRAVARGRTDAHGRLRVVVPAGAGLRVGLVATRTLIPVAAAVPGR